MKILTLSEMEDSQEILNCTTVDFTNLEGCTFFDLIKQIISGIFKIVLKLFMLHFNAYKDFFLGGIYLFLNLLFLYYFGIILDFFIFKIFYPLFLARKIRKILKKYEKSIYLKHGISYTDITRDCYYLDKLINQHRKFSFKYFDQSEEANILLERLKIHKNKIK